MKIPSLQKVAWITALPIISYGIFHIVITLAVSKMGIALNPPAEMSWDDHQDWIRSGAWFREALFRGLVCILLPLLVVFVLNVVTNPKLAPIAKFVKNSVRHMMRLLCTPTKLIPIFCGIAVLSFLLGHVFELPSNIVGGIVANIDMMRGRYKIKCCGMPSSSAWMMGKLLRTQYGVERDQIACCRVTTWQRGYANGYNFFSAKRIQKKFKKDYLFEEASYLAQLVCEDHDRGSAPVRTRDGFVIPEATLRRTSTDPSFGYTLSNPVKLNGGEKGEKVMVYLSRLRNEYFDGFTITHPGHFQADKNCHVIERYTLKGCGVRCQVFVDPQHTEIQESEWMAPTGMWLDPGVAR